MRHTGRVIGITVLALLLIAAALKIKEKLAPKQARRAPVPNVLVATPRIETVQNILEFTGDVEPNRTVGIYSRVSGNVEKITVQVGDRVKAGQLLAQIDTSEFHQTSLQTIATYQNSKLLYERKLELFGKNLISPQELDNARAAMEVSLANYESARLRLSYASIVAPFSGVISERFFDPGALINANNAILFTLNDYEIVKVTANVLEKDVPKVRKGMEAELIVDAWKGDKFTGVLKRTSESLDPSTRTMKVEIEIPNSDHRLKPGMFGTIRIVLDTHTDALTTSTDVLLKDAESYYLWVVRGGKAFKQRIEIGWNTVERTEIINGLTLADTVVTLGAQLLREGGPVNISHR